jgi:ferredoxin--NADP+ reductase
MLAMSGAQVALFNRDIKPGGLAEYGIYYDKYKMKDGLRKQFRQILEMPGIEYIGNVSLGAQTGLSLADLPALGFQAVMVTVGAQGTKWLGLPGENLTGVYHAKDIVYHYNKLPPFSTQPFEIGRKVAVVGVGNVMLDIAHWLVWDCKVDEVIAVARRGPAEVKFTKKELEYIARNLNLSSVDSELERVKEIMHSVGQDPEASRQFFLSSLSKAEDSHSPSEFRFDFLASPTAILGDDTGRVAGLEVENTTLLAKDGDTKARGLGTRRVIECDTVIFAIGDKVDGGFGLPVQGSEFVKNPTPAFPVDGVSYEAYDPQAGKPVTGVFVAGWSREASSGLVGVARKDGENGARAVVQYLRMLGPAANPETSLQQLYDCLKGLGRPLVRLEDLKRLEVYEQEEAQRLGLPELKLKTDRDMLKAMGLL